VHEINAVEIDGKYLVNANSGHCLTSSSQDGKVDSTGVGPKLRS
jgi:hypothetical protein